ncbi:hypothetical protein AVEN_56043-1 [Araneus ventricosus]|uniref:Uncharacterized protein n=1 Tax=Araneus ventricosus TaxID=182803 RepID=A0A4Y2DLM5_ARAVE|nr:hypothetical protein AVEN_56043-1 [Araneus ventricosus]
MKNAVPPCVGVHLRYGDEKFPHKHAGSRLPGGYNNGGVFLMDPSTRTRPTSIRGVVACAARNGSCNASAIEPQFALHCSRVVPFTPGACNEVANSSSTALD